MTARFLPLDSASVTERLRVATRDFGSLPDAPGPPVDMSAEAVTRRLREAVDLYAACLVLGALKKAVVTAEK